MIILVIIVKSDKLKLKLLTTLTSTAIINKRFIHSLFVNLLAVVKLSALVARLNYLEPL